MKKALIILFISLAINSVQASSILFESFEYANHDLQSPSGWICDDSSWLCGYLEKDHHRTAHTGNWYAFTDTPDSWMFMPLHMSAQLKYRFSCWVISDGSYTLEFWAGNAATTEGMSQLLFTTTVNSDNYELVTEYIESLTADHPYFGIHALAGEGAYHLTIDDVNIDMIEKYDFMATPTNADTMLYPGTQTNFHFKVQNLGYEAIDVILSPSHEFFNEIQFIVDDSPCTVFHLEPEEIKEVVTMATLPAEALPGTTCWLDIMLVLDCNCATSMTTLWVAVLDATGVAEHAEGTFYPNPAEGAITIEGQGTLSITNITGQVIINRVINGKETFSLPKGLYLVQLGSKKEKVVVR